MSVDLNLKCRTCLSDSNTYQLHDYIEENYKILDMLDGIVPQIDFKTTTQFSTSMCQSCVDKLLIGYKFQQLCIATNNRLHDLWGMSLIKIEPEQITIPIMGISCVKVHQEIEDDSTKFKVSPNEPEGEINSVNGVESNSDLSSNCQKDSRQCGKRFRRTSGPRDHKRRHKDSKKHQCPECPKRFYYKRDLTQHQKVHVNTTNLEKEKKAELRNVAEEKASEAIDDMPKVKEKPISKSRKTSERYACETCGEIFPTPSLLKKHSPAHSLAKSHECQICFYRFSTAILLNGHLCKKRKNGTVNKRKPHKPKIKPVCSICKKEFSSNYNLKEHMRLHSKSGEKSFYCIECGKTFNYASNLKTHLRTHTVKRPYQCSQCGNTFRHSSSLRRHMEIHKKVFSSNNYKFKDHNRLHSGEKSLYCTECGKTFKYASSVKEHMRSHSVKRPFQCSQCGKTFRHSGSLKRHMEGHTV